MKLNDAVTLNLSSEQGVIIGIAHYLNDNTQYQISYLDSQGCQKRDWFIDAEFFVNPQPVPFQSN